MLRVHSVQERTAIERAWLTGLKASVQRILQRLHLGFVLFQQSQTCPDHIAGRAIAAAVDLGIDEAGEVHSEGYGCVSAHECSPVGVPIVPIIGTCSQWHSVAGCLWRSRLSPTGEAGGGDAPGHKKESSCPQVA